MRGARTGERERERGDEQLTDDPSFMNLRMNDDWETLRRLSNNNLSPISTECDLGEEKFDSEWSWRVSFTLPPSNVINFTSNARCSTMDVT